MNSQKLKVGDKVRLPSEKDPITIERIDEEGRAVCVYINSKTGDYKTVVIHKDALILYVENCAASSLKS